MTSDEKILVCVHHVPNGEQLIRRGGELSNLFHCPLYVLNITPEHASAHKQKTEGLNVQWQQICDKWEATLVTKTCDAKKVVDMIADVAKQYGITQLIIGQSGQTRWQEIWHRSFINELLREMDGVDIHVVSVDRLISAAKEDATAIAHTV